jgi:hypothetical protein
MPDYALGVDGSLFPRVFLLALILCGRLPAMPTVRPDASLVELLVRFAILSPQKSSVKSATKNMVDVLLII